MPIGIGEGLAAAGAIGNYFQGRSAANAQKEMSRRQAQLIGAQTGLFNQTVPQYQQLLQEYARRAGIGGGGYSQEYGNAMSQRNAGALPPGASGYQPGGTITQYRQGPNDGLMPEDRIRLEQLREGLNQQGRYGANQLRFNMGLQGLNQGAQGEAQRRLQSDLAKAYSRGQQQIGLDAIGRQDQRLAAFQNALGFGLGQGSQAAGGYGQQAQMYGNQAQQAYGGIGDIVSQYQYGQNLRRYGQQEKKPGPWRDGSGY